MVQLQVAPPQEGIHIHRFTVDGGRREVVFTVIPEETQGECGWAVRIEGIPAPSIVHERPWPTVEAAQAAAMRAIRVILELERVQHAEEERARHHS